MIKDAIAKLADRASLTEQEAEAVMLEIMDGAATSAQIAAYLMGLRLKGETVEEISGSVRAMRAKAIRIAVGRSPGRGYVWYRRGWGAHVQYFHHDGVRPCRRRFDRGKARQPFGVIQVRECRRALGPRGQDRSADRTRGRLYQ